MLQLVANNILQKIRTCTFSFSKFYYSNILKLKLLHVSIPAGSSSGCINIKQLGVKNHVKLLLTTGTP